MKKKRDISFNSFTGNFPASINNITPLTLMFVFFFKFNLSHF